MFVDGNPTGLKTPAVLKGLPVRRAVEIAWTNRVTKGRQSRLFSTKGRRACDVQLREVSSRVRFRGVPRNAAAFLDDAPIDAAGTVVAPAGTHRLRVEAGSNVLYSKSIELEAGAEIVDRPDPGTGNP